MIIIGLDPGLRTFGMGAVNEHGRVVDLRAIETLPGKDKPAKGKGKTAWELRERSRRVSEILNDLEDFITANEPIAIVAEAGMGLGPNVGIGGTISLATGQAIAAMTAWRFCVPIVWSTQLEWRRTMIPNPKSGRRGTYEQSEIVAAVGADVERMAIANLRALKRSITLRDHAIDAAGLARWGTLFSLVVQQQITSHKRFK